MKEKQRTKLVLVGVIIISFSLFLSFREKEIGIITEGFVKRGSKEEQDKKTILSATYEGIKIEDIDFTVSALSYSEKEFIDTIEENKESIIYKLLGNNESVNDVHSDLVFYEKYESLPFCFLFQSMDTSVIADDGTIETVSESRVCIEATVTYLQYEYKFNVFLIVKPGAEVKERVYKKNIQDTLEKMNEEKDAEEILYLPNSIDGKEVVFSETIRKFNPIYLFAGFLTVFALFFANNQDSRKEIQKRKDSILWEYPIVLQNISMYIVAGMSIRNAWKKVLSDAKEKNRRNPIYDEIETIVNEMESGIAEINAYERFAVRVNIPEITRFMAIVSQNLKRGSERLSIILLNEAKTAMDQNKYRIKRKAEEAGTKLLFPMMILLIMVMALIMVPAFMNL